MLARASFLAALVALTSLSGCIGAPEDEPVDPADGNATPTVTQEELQEAPDGRGEISAFKETNATEQTSTGSIMHGHDYWNGKERLEVGWINAGLIPFPLFPCKKADASCSAGSTAPSTSPNSGDTYPAGTTIADFDLAPPPEMGMVYEGTKTIELNMVKYTGPEGGPANPTGQVFFDYLAANDEPGKWRTGGELKLNEPFSIDIEPTDADMPHQTKSLWIFRIYSNSNMGWFEFNITLTAVRGYDVVNWPPHPDLYAAKPDRVVFEGPVKLSSKGTIDSNLFGSDAGWLHPEKVISWGTDRLEIEVKDVKFTGTVPVSPQGYVLEYHNASKPPLLGHGAQFGGRLKDASSDGTTYNFGVDLTGDRGDAYDTPYAQYSRWGFRFVPRWDDSDQSCPSSVPTPTGGDIGPFLQQFLVGCQWYPWTIEYTMKITAYGRSTAGGAPEAIG